MSTKRIWCPTFGEVAGRILYAFAPTEDLAGDIEDRFALHLAIVSSQITKLPVEFVGLGDTLALGKL